MPNIHRLTDNNSGGGAINSIPQSTVFANQLLISINGSIGTGHAPCPVVPVHCEGAWQTNEGSTTVFIHNTPVNFLGNADTCGHTRVAGSPTVFVNSFGGGGAIIDNNPPYVSPPTGGQPTPPPEYTTNTIADVHIYENNDDPEGTLSGPAPNTTINAVSELESDLDNPIAVPPIVHGCAGVDSLPNNFNWANEPGATTFAAWASTFQLSANFTVADLTINTAVSYYPFTNNLIQNCGLTQKDILLNLCFLANNTLEPMLSLYGPFTITSAFRNKSGSSKHNIGQASDIQFIDLHGQPNTGTLYFQRAQHIRDNISYDAMILEWFGRNPWIHISANSTGHRNLVQTQTSPNTYELGLKLLG